jgi:uncharacterized delta-60 repeat protein
MLFYKSVRRQGSSAGRPAPVIQPLESRLLMSAGDLDTTFGTGGRAQASGTFVSGAADKLAIQSDGKLLLPAGSGNGGGVTITRLDADGSVDTSYGDGNGIGFTNFPNVSFVDLRDFDLQSDGKALVTVQAIPIGAPAFGAIARFDNTGFLDENFGDGGIAPTPNIDGVGAGAPAGRGGVIVAGQNAADTNAVAIIRLNSAGQLDTSFAGGKGSVSVPLDGFADTRGVLRQSNGKLLILAAANDSTRVIRINADGTVDNSFGTSGIAKAPDSFPRSPKDFVLQPSGKIVVRRVNDSDGAIDSQMLVRFNANGTLDTSFGDQGVVRTDFGNQNGGDGQIAVDKTGDIVTIDSTDEFGETNSDIRVARFDAVTGNLDTTFGAGGVAVVDLSGNGVTDFSGAVVTDSQNRIVAYGTIGTGSGVSLGVARLLGDGTKPTASITPPVPVSGSAFTDFDVLFSDDVALNTQTIDAADVTVTGPGTAALAVALQTITPGGGGASATATYRITAPGGTWTDAANGTYTVVVKPDAVSDNAGNTSATTRTTFKVAFAPPDTQVPVATLDAAAPPASGTANYQFTVTYTDNVAVAGGNGTNDQIQVTGPGGFSQNATFVSATGSGATRTFKYAVTAPGGTWDQADNGTYSVAVTGTNPVADTAGNKVAAGEVGTFEVNLGGVGAGSGPVATFPSGQAPPASGAASYDFDVTYSDANVVNAATIDGGDIVVTGPNGFSAQASLVSGGLSNGSIVTATYRITAPGGAFDEADNGTYSVAVLPNAVANIPGDPSPAGTIGTFKVTLGAAAVGTLDPSFGNGTGVVSFDPPGPGLKSQDTLALSDGSTVTAAFTNVAAGSADVTLFKTTPQGTLDTSFGGSNNGLVVLDVGGDDRATGIVQLPDGRFVVSGTSSTVDGNGVATSSRFFVARFNANGTVDTTFGNGSGFALSPAAAGVFDRANDLVALPDNSVLVFGQSTATDPNGDIAIARFTADGSYDTTFGNAGRVLTDLGGDDEANAVVLAGGGKFVVAGSTETADHAGSFAAVRYNADGSLDTTFGDSGSGFVLIDFRPGLDDGKAIVEQGDGALVLGGLASTGDPDDPSFDSDFALARLTPDGVLDESFGSGGKVMTDFGVLTTISKLVILPGGKIVASGQALNTLGDIGTADVQVAIARYNTDGTLDSTFSADGKIVINFEAAENGTGGVSSSALHSLAGEIKPLADADPTTLEQQFEQFRQEAQGLIAVTQGGAILAIATQGSDVELARVIGDAGAPSALVALLPNVTETDVANVTFVVRYIDDLAVDTSSLGTGDIRVTGPNGFAQDAVFVGFVGGSDPAPEVTARYSVSDPSGSFVKADEGTYSLSINANQIADVNGNTLAGQPIPSATFTVTVPENLANLHVDGGLTGKFPAAVVGGAKTKGATLKLTNTGDQDAKTTVAVTVFASADQELDETQDTSIAVINGVKLAVKKGKGKTVKLKFTQFPSSLPDGDYYLIARVDSGDALPELKKSDNNAVTATPINIAAPFTDLSGSAGSIKGTPAPGAKLSASALVANAGNVAVKASVPVAIVASPGDQALGNGDTTIATPTVKMSINPSASKNIKLSFTIPATGLAPGTYSLLAVLDAGGTLTTEKNVANNVVVLGEFTIS